jgi:hypothetical protein
MVKDLKKTRFSQPNIINNVLSENKKPKKQIDSDYYQKNKEKKKQEQRERYAKQKEQGQSLAQKYYQASNIKALLTLKEYTELNREKMKL